MPFVLVCAVVFGLTFVLFNVPATAPVAIVPPAAPKLSTTDRAALNDSLTQAMRLLDGARTARPPVPARAAPTTTRSSVHVAPSTAVSPLPVAPVGAPPVVPALSPAAFNTAPAEAPVPTEGPSPAEQTLSAVSALSNAIQAARNARTEADLVYAEQQMRIAREQMEANCGDNAGPMCQSAEQIRNMWF